VAGRFPGKDVVPYIVAQVLGGIVAGAALHAIASGAPGFSASDGFASNGYGEHSPQHYSLQAALLCETVLTFMFVSVFLGITSEHAAREFAPLAIGLALTLIHLISIPVTNTSVNPARSTAVAVFQGGWAIGQLWAFWLAPLVGAVLGGLFGRWLYAALNERIVTLRPDAERWAATHRPQR